jgi:hypothetical protein
MINNAQSVARRSRHGWWLIAAGILMIDAAWVMQRDRMGMPSNALRLPAQVVSIERKTQRLSDFDETLYSPRVRFTRPDGLEVVFVSNVWTPTVRHLEGQPIQVLLDPRTGQAVVDSKSSLHGAFMIVGGVGALLLLFGISRVIPRLRRSPREVMNAEPTTRG